MQNTRALAAESAGLPSLFVVAFLSSALTVVMAGLLLLALNFGFAGGVDPILGFLKKAGVLSESKQQTSVRANLTQVPKLDAKGPLGGKSSVTISVAFKSPDPVQSESPVDVVIDSKDAEPEVEPIEVGFEEPVVGFEQPANLPEGIPAMLRRKSNGIEIGNFRSVTMDGAADECLNLGYSMLSAAKANQDLLDVMVTNKQITIANICAANGKVVFSCRNGKISISPRRARPDDSCSRA